MPQKHLDVFDADAILEEVRGKAVPAAMGRYTARDAGFGSAFLEEGVDTALVKISSILPTWKEDIHRSAAFKPVLG